MTWPRCTIQDTGLDTFYLDTPYDEKFVAAIKHLPEDDRHWDSDLHVWIIDWNHYEYVQGEVKKAFDQFAQETHP